MIIHCPSCAVLNANLFKTFVSATKTFFLSGGPGDYFPELHMLFQGFVESTEEARRARTGDKREEGDNGNECRARAGGDGKEKEINSIHSFRYRFP